MLAIAPALVVALALSPSAPSTPPLSSLLEEALAVTEAPARFRLQPPPGALVGIADGNGDGIADVVIAASRSRGAWLLPGDGKGGFGEVGALDRSVGPQGVGDLDADGAAEQLSGGALGTEMVLVHGKPAGPSGAALAADLDRDGQVDLARLEGGALRISFAEPGREASLGVGSEVVSLAASDVDRDGALDLLVADAHGDEVSVFLGDGEGRFRAAGGYRVWLRPFSMAAGDLDGDGATDLVVSDQCGGTLAMLRGNGSGGFADPVLVSQPSSAGKTAASEPAPRVVKSLTLRPAVLRRTDSVPGEATVLLEAPAPAEGLTLKLRSSDPALVPVEAEVIVPAGETSVTFPVAPSAGRRGRLSYMATLTAAAEGSAASASLTVAPE